MGVRGGEGPAALPALSGTASREGITINRVSQGSGGMLLAESELRDMAAIGAEAGLEICLFVPGLQRYRILHRFASPKWDSFAVLFLLG